MAIFAIKCFGTQENDFRKWEKLMSRISVFNRTKLKKNKNNLMKLGWMENESPFYFLIQLVCDCLSNSLYCSQIPQQNVQFQLDLKPTGTLGLL